MTLAITFEINNERNSFLIHDNIKTERIFKHDSDI